MSEIIDHKCGIVLAYTLHDAYNMMAELQHRGREAAGIAAIGPDRIDVLKWIGRVRDFDRGDLHRIFPGKEYHAFMGHVRYATKGRKNPQEILVDAHPHVIGGTVINHGVHQLILNCEMAMVHNGQVNVSSLDQIVKENLRTGCDTEALLHYYAEVGEKELVRTVPGSYTAIIADRKNRDIIVIRDPSGNRPGFIGRKGEKHCAASESIAIFKNGGTSISDLVPGTIYYFDPHGFIEDKPLFSPTTLREKKSHCMFEFLYLAHPDSVIDGVSVHAFRAFLGEELARECANLNAEVVTYVPRSPELAAASFARVSGIPAVDVFYKTDGQRSFMGSTQDERQKAIDSNLYLIPSAVDRIRGKKVAVIEDSIVRGTVARRVRDLLITEAGVAEATLCSYTPPIGIIGEDNVARGCEYGVDMPTEETPNHKFIARISDEKMSPVRNATLDEISQKAGMPVRYLSTSGLARVFEKVGLPFSGMCSYCIGGKKPF